MLCEMLHQQKMVLLIDSSQQQGMRAPAITLYEDSFFRKMHLTASNIFTFSVFN